jgi:hypothetical protein
MSLTFVDSFDHYDTVDQKWDNGGADFNTDPAFVRTGTQSLAPGGGGFDTLPRKDFPHVDTMTCGFAFILSSFAGNNNVAFFFNQSGGGFVSGDLFVNPDGSLTVKLSNGGVTLGTTVGGLIVPNAFSYIEFQGTFTNPGSCLVRVNGQVVFTRSGIDMTGGTGAAGIDGFFLPGSNQLNFFYDDLYLLDSSNSGIPNTPNDSFLGAVQIFAILPDLDETPLDWTPLASTNVSQVNQEPPPGDSAYVFSNTPGAIDQYHYTPTGPPGAYQIFGLQHSLSARLDAAGSHSICSQVGTNSGFSQAVQGAYDFVVTPWDGNPETGNAWLVGDFSSTFLGPQITS